MIVFPTQPSNYTIQAELKGAEGHPVRSFRDVQVLGRGEFEKPSAVKQSDFR